MVTNLITDLLDNDTNQSIQSPFGNILSQIDGSKLDKGNVQSLKTDSLKNFQILDDLRKLIIKKQNQHDQTISSGSLNSMHLEKPVSEVSFKLE